MLAFGGKQSSCSLSCPRWAMTPSVWLLKHKAVTLGASAAVRGHGVFPCSWPLGYVLQKQGSSSGQAQGGPAAVKMKPLQPPPAAWNDARLFVTLKTRKAGSPSQLTAAWSSASIRPHLLTPVGCRTKRSRCCTLQGEELNL